MVGFGRQEFIKHTTEAEKGVLSSRVRAVFCGKERLDLSIWEFSMYAI